MAAILADRNCQAVRYSTEWDELHDGYAEELTKNGFDSLDIQLKLNGKKAKG